MRRPVVIVATVFTVAAIALSLHTLSTAMGSDESCVLRPLFASSIDRPSIIAGTVFEDANGNGDKDAGETGITGVTVTLDVDNDSVDLPSPETTGPDGGYSFTVTWADTYTVTATTPAGYVGTTDERVVARITGPEQQKTVDFGYRVLFTVHLPVVGKSFP